MGRAAVMRTQAEIVARSYRWLSLGTHAQSAITMYEYGSIQGDEWATSRAFRGGAYDAATSMRPSRRSARSKAGRPRRRGRMKRRPEQPHGEPAALLFGALLELALEGPTPREACCG